MKVVFLPAAREDILSVVEYLLGQYAYDAAERFLHRLKQQRHSSHGIHTRALHHCMIYALGLWATFREFDSITSVGLQRNYGLFASSMPHATFQLRLKTIKP